MEHPSDQQLLSLHQAGDSRGREALDRHLEACPDCRRRLAGQMRFAAAVRRGLPREPAPASLIGAIVRGIGQEAAGQAARGSRAWRRAMVGGVAAVLMAGLGLAVLFFMAPQGDLHPMESVPALTSETSPIRGQLVCVGCARGGADLESQRACVGDGDLHVTGLQTPDGNLWRFMEGEPIRNYKEDRQLRGVWLEVEAHTYPDIGYLQIAAVQRL